MKKGEKEGIKGRRERRKGRREGESSSLPNWDNFLAIPLKSICSGISIKWKEQIHFPRFWSPVQEAVVYALCCLFIVRDLPGTILWGVSPLWCTNTEHPWWFFKLLFLFSSSLASLKSFIPMSAYFRGWLVIAPIYFHLPVSLHTLPLSVFSNFLFSEANISCSFT